MSAVGLFLSYPSVAGQCQLVALLRPKLEGSNPHVTGRSEGARNFSA